MSDQTYRVLIRSKGGTVHSVRPDGKTHCGRTLNGLRGFMFTSTDGGRSRPCFNCLSVGGIEEARPLVDYRCEACGEVVSTYGHNHYTSADSAEHVVADAVEC